MVGSQNFNSPQHILQQDLNGASYPSEGYSHHFPIEPKYNGNVLQSRQDILKKSKKQKKGPFLVNIDFREVVEMSYWLVKFVGQFEKQYKAYISNNSDQKLKSQTGKGHGLFSKNTATLVSYARFFLKFLGSFEKLYKKL